MTMDDFIAESVIEPQPEVLTNEFPEEQSEAGFESAQGFGSEPQAKRARKKKSSAQATEASEEPTVAPEVKRHHEEPRPLTPKKAVPQRRVKAAVRSITR